jgi:hypothetical protein
MVSKHAGNDISRELSYSKRSNRGKYTARNIKLYDEYKASGAEYTMTFIEYKKKQLKKMRAEKKS